MKTKIYGHRGSKGSYPENSMLAFKKAIDAGVDGMELDIHMTKDGELVVIHDATLDRTTTGIGYVKDHTLDQIKALSIGAKFTEFRHYDSSWDLEQVPTLAEALTLFKSHDLEVNIELKTYEVAYPGIEEKMLKIVKDSGYDPNKVVYSAFHLPTLLRIQLLDEQAKTAWLLEHQLPMPDDYLQMLNLEALHVDYKVVLKHPAQWQPIAHQLRIWTVNELHDMKALVDLGVKAIVTDHPEIATMRYSS
ncbi:MAG: glycerophosphodiester phosphodiesterase [Defluviitaleaceae bacterium]|nr:glycerophosphodiester phosphodiesterase [Defluviitaleaceae bacterium]